MMLTLFFFFVLHFANVIFEWGENFTRAHLVCRFEKLKATFCKCYQKLQMNKQVYMALRVIKQGGDNKVEVYYEYILNLTNCL
jgi:hypothetical protein